MSSSQAKSYHSITIGEMNTWDDWHLVPSSRPLVSPPKANISYQDMSYADGMIDMTEILSDDLIYGNRSGSWEFIVVNAGQLPNYDSQTTWVSRYSTIMNYIHGQYFERIILDDDPTYFYSGRLSLSGWNSAKGNSTLQINYVLDPYKRKVSNPNSKTF